MLLFHTYSVIVVSSVTAFEKILTTSVAVTKKADRTAYDVCYRLSRTEQPIYNLPYRYNNVYFRFRLYFYTL